MSPSDIQIRKAQSGEESAIHESHMRSIREVCIKDHGEDEIKGWGNRPLGNRWTDAIKNGHVWVVTQGGKIYGHGSIQFQTKDGLTSAHINGLYLTPEILGKGLGLKLAQVMIETAKKKAVKKITLQSTLTAHKFYKKLGFRDLKPMERIEIAGYPVRTFSMGMELEATQTLTLPLQKYFGFTQFRPHQEEVCQSAARGEDLLLVMPTGAGKSLCYQLPALVRGGTTLVISPLIALMDDQAIKLKARGLRAEALHSGRDRMIARQICRD